MKRREFITLVLSAVTACAAQARAQATPARVIGFLSGGSPYEWAPFVAAFREGLSESGYLEGRNASIEFRWAVGERERVPALARDLVANKVDVIVASGGLVPIQASREASSTIPIIALFGEDPVKEKMVAALERPGGNVTGVIFVSRDMDVRRLQVLREIVPKAATVGLIANPAIPPAIEVRSGLEDAARLVGLQSIVIPASTEAEIDDAFAKLVQQRADALVVANSAYFLDRRDRFASLAARHHIPAIYPARAYVEAGGLVSYGVDRLEIYRQVGLYTGRILHGGAPAEMPVLQPSKFELAVNAKAAKAIGVTLPQAVLARADAVIR
jgi:putative ABC transport system substrate-binding protein